ncbi:GDSL-type esterase/lipase family protein [Microbacterium sp. P02]|uniref:GDSL-type esterase/lipase family protein n=1 Tax=Microbacterium sp. P02 TaxID=3366260 RepID=UPI003670230F
MRASQFAELAPSPAEVVFIGDSITAGGLWHEWFPEVSVANRGIDGDTTEGVLARLSSAVAGAPARVFILIGTNDLSWKVSPDVIVGRVTQILDGIRGASPTTEIFLQSVMPRNAKFHDRITDLNRRYRHLAQEQHVTYLDLWPALADSDGALTSHFTLDGLHLNGAGYRAWSAVLRPLVS